jgi:hypothetical protein
VIEERKSCHLSLRISNSGRWPVIVPLYRKLGERGVVGLSENPLAVLHIKRTAENFLR